MKKLTFVIIVVISALFVSCDQLEEITEVGLNTILRADMPVISLKSNEVYNFTSGGTFALTDNQDIEEYIDNIRDIIANDGSLIQFNNAQEGNKIMTLHMKYGVISDPGKEPQMKSIFSFSGHLQAKDGAIKYLNDSWSHILIKGLVADKDKVFAIKLEGTANYNVNVPIKLEVPVRIDATPLSKN